MSSEIDLIVLALASLLIIIVIEVVNRKNHSKELRNVVIKTKIKYIMDAGDNYTFAITSWVNPADQKLYIFKSGNISYKQRAIIAKNQIEELLVRYESGNIKNYEVDVKSLEEVNYETNQ